MAATKIVRVGAWDIQGDACDHAEKPVPCILSTKSFLPQPYKEDQTPLSPTGVKAGSRRWLLLSQENPVVSSSSIPYHPDALWKAPGHLLLLAHTN